MMHKNRKHRKIAAFFLLGACVLIFFILNICIGSVRIALPDVARIFSGQESNGTVTRILWDIRLPRAIAVLLLGVRFLLPDIFCKHSSIIRLQDRLF